MEAIEALLLLFVLFLAAGVYAAVRAVRAAKRGVDRTLAQARRTVEETSLRARSLARPGPAGELAQLRLSVRTSLRATAEALRAHAADDPSLGESLDLFRRLSAHGTELDEQLGRAEREPDKRHTAARLPELRERAERIRHSADSLRWAAQDRARRFADEDLAELGRQIDMETGALRHWTPASEPVSEAASGAGAGAPPGPVSAPGAEPPAAPEQSLAAGEPPALEAPPDHSRQPGHSWQQAARPQQGPS